MKSKLYRAGLLPYVIEDGRVEFMFMLPSDSRFGGDRYQIAKGKVEEGETTEEAAIREASEELGLVKNNIFDPIFLGDFLGRTSVYIAKVKDKRNFNAPNFETKDTKWMSVAEFQIEGRMLHLPIIQEALRTILQQDNLMIR